MEDVLKTVNAGKRKYDMRTKHMDARRWLRKLSRGILYYASILDVIAQHHPEYVSLAWGAMKFTLVGIINHEHLVVELSKALCTVADVLPNAELKNLLYPTEQMKHAVAVLYTQILELLERAAQWYKAGKIRHFIGSITKPDIVEEISIAARRVDQLAISASMAEQRDMNLQQQEMRLEQKLTYEAVLEVKRITKARDFAIDAIDFIEESQVPMIWALNVDGQQDATVSLTEVLKHLILQVLRINHTMLTEKSLALNAAQFQSATTLADWIKIFAAVLRGIPHAYIVIDAEVTRDQYEAQWPQVFELLFDELKKQRIESVVKSVFRGAFCKTDAHGEE
ncbi:hypothetical protein M7I_4727 [Glarea lozoyensis 74030]|uniref:DUF7708 domain-containing protein n=1 Tax=Glarea lozoyensis (strain ATCC 74030 / MF5533) TaxID=1104152 RepID=H0EPY7_GLAL7|nr:hypothetical protein M7I_4727 [Glarea lozoyensis 74030]